MTYGVRSAQIAYAVNMSGAPLAALTVTDQARGTKTPFTFWLNGLLASTNDVVSTSWKPPPVARSPIEQNACAVALVTAVALDERK